MFPRGSPFGREVPAGRQEERRPRASDHLGEKRSAHSARHQRHLVRILRKLLPSESHRIERERTGDFYFLIFFRFISFKNKIRQNCIKIKILFFIYVNYIIT